MNGCNCAPMMCQGAESGGTIQMLKSAICDEYKMARYFRYLAEKTKCKEQKEVLYGLREDAKRHGACLQKMYKESFCKEHRCDKLSVHKPKDFCAGIKEAICKEMDGITRYERLANQLRSMKHKEIVCCILNEKRAHAQKLAAIYKKCYNPCKYCK